MTTVRLAVPAMAAALLVPAGHPAGAVEAISGRWHMSMPMTTGLAFVAERWASTSSWDTDYSCTVRHISSGFTAEIVGGRCQLYAYSVAQQTWTRQGSGVPIAHVGAGVWSVRAGVGSLPDAADFYLCVTAQERRNTGTVTTHVICTPSAGNVHVPPA